MSVAAVPLGAPLTHRPPAILSREMCRVCSRNVTIRPSLTRTPRTRDRPSNVRGTWNEGWRVWPIRLTTRAGRGQRKSCGARRFEDGERAPGALLDPVSRESSGSDDPFALLADREPITETVAPGEPHSRERDP